MMEPTSAYRHRAEQSLCELEQFVDRHGRVPRSASLIGDEARIARWAFRIQNGQFLPEYLQARFGAAMHPTPTGRSDTERLEQFEAFVAAHGRMPRPESTPEEAAIHEWVTACFLVDRPSLQKRFAAAVAATQPDSDDRGKQPGDAVSTNAEALLEDWLVRSQRAAGRRSQVRALVRSWLTWCASRGKDPLSADPEELLAWAGERKRQVSPQTFRIQLRCIWRWYQDVADQDADSLDSAIRLAETVAGVLGRRPSTPAERHRHTTRFQTRNLLTLIRAAGGYGLTLRAAAEALEVSDERARDIIALLEIRGQLQRLNYRPLRWRAQRRSGNDNVTGPVP